MSTESETKMQEVVLDAKETSFEAALRMFGMSKQEVQELLGNKFQCQAVAIRFIAKE